MIDALSGIDPSELFATYGIVLLRATGVFVFVPIFGSDLLPMRIRVIVAAAIALALMPLVPANVARPEGLFEMLIAASRELGLGLGLGLAARAIFSGIEAAASVLAVQSGFAMANMVDPTSGDQALSPALFQNLLTIALFLAANLHHLFIGALVSSFELLPPGVDFLSAGSLDLVGAELGGRMFFIAVQMAAPALIVTIAVDMVMALVGRAMPQVPILLVAYPLKLSVGMAAMLMLATLTGRSIDWLGTTMIHDGGAVLRALGGIR